MGIYDRDYYRDHPGWNNPFGRAQSTVFLCLLLSALFIAQLATMEAPGLVAFRATGMTEFMQLDSVKVFNGEVWRVLTYAFAHEPLNFFHIIFTLIFLVWIGHSVEDIYGGKEYLYYFFFTSLLGGLVYIATAAIVPGVPPLVGPSGAVTSILLLFALHYPTRTINLFCLIPVPVWLIVILYALVDIAGLTSGGANPAVVGVHFIGAAFAVAYHTFTWRIVNWLPSLGQRSSPRRRAKPRLRLFQEQPQPEPAATASGNANAAPALALSGEPINEQLEAKLDEVLEKVARSGKESLTDAEREILLRASEIYKKRRQSN